MSKRALFSIVGICGIAIAATAQSADLTPRTPPHSGHSESELSASAGIPRTVARTQSRLEAFDADSGRVGWISGSCRQVRVLKLGTRKIRTMGSARSTGCNLVGEPRLALGRSLALWTVVAIGNSSYHYLFRTAFRHPRARRIALIQHEVDGYGDYVTGLAGDGSIVAYSQVFVASETIGDTDYFWSDRGAVKRVRARSTAVLARGNPPALLAVGGGRIAYVVADRARRRSPRIRAAATGPIIVDTGAGSPVTRVSPGGRVRALAVTASRLAALVVTPAGRRIERYALPSGSLLGTTAVPRRTASLLSASGHVVAFSTGTRIRRLDLRSGATRSIARVRGALVGLAVSGRMLVWAENRGRHGRVRSLALR